MQDLAFIPKGGILGARLEKKDTYTWVPERLFFWSFYHHLWKHNKIKARNVRVTVLIPKSHWFGYMFFIQNHNLHTHPFCQRYHGKSTSKTRSSKIPTDGTVQVVWSCHSPSNSRKHGNVIPHDEHSTYLHIYTNEYIRIRMYMYLFVLHWAVLWFHNLLQIPCGYVLKVDHSWICIYCIFHWISPTLHGKSVKMSFFDVNSTGPGRCSDVSTTHKAVFWFYWRKKTRWKMFLSGQKPGGGFKHFSLHPYLAFWEILFRWVETTNQKRCGEWI